MEKARKKKCWEELKKIKKKKKEFPGGLIVKTLCFHSRGMGSIPGPLVKKVLHATWYSQTKKEFF